MPNRLIFDGLEELKAELRALPETLRDDAKGIVLARAERAKQDIQTAYPERTGNLKKGLSVRTLDVGPLAAAAEVRNRAPHAEIFENGTQARHTDLGANRGSMPPGHIFIPTVIRQRRAMFQDLAELLTRHGLAVTGEAD